MLMVIVLFQIQILILEKKHKLLLMKKKTLIYLLKLYLIKVSNQLLLIEMLKSFATKELNVENANAFLEFFEELPNLYKGLSFEKIMELKNLINTALAESKPQDNKIFEKEGVKNKLILLNYLVDMEDLFV